MSRRGPSRWTSWSASQNTRSLRSSTEKKLDRAKTFFARSIRPLALLGVGLGLLILAIRLVSTFRYGDLIGTTGGEEITVYAIWKVQRGLPLYEWSDRFPYFHTLYNFLFYFFYAAILSLWSATNESIFLLGRLITLAFALAGIAISWLVLRMLDAVGPSEARAKTVVLSLLVLAWINPIFMGWWILTVRPDVASVFFVTTAVWLWIKGVRDEQDWLLAGASCFFFLAWAFKQSVVTVFPALVIVLALRKQWREAAWLVVPALIGIVTTMLAAPGPYWHNTITAHAVAPIDVGMGLKLFIESVPLSMAFFAAPLIVAIRAIKDRGWMRTPAGNLDFVQPLGLAFLCAFVIAVPGLAKSGSSRNILMESYVVGAVITTIIAGRSIRAGNHRGYLIPISAGLVVLLGFSTLQLAAFNRIGTLALGEGHLQLQKGTCIAEHAPEPLFTTQAALALPWHSTGNTYPALVLNDHYYRPALGQGLIEDGGLEARARSGYFGSLLLRASDLNLVGATSLADYQVAQDAVRTPAGTWDLYTKDRSALAVVAGC